MYYFQKFIEVYKTICSNLVADITDFFSPQEFFGFYPEEPWCEVRVTARGGEERAVCYLNKLTGAMQVGGRPQDFRPTLRVRLSF